MLNGSDLAVNSINDVLLGLGKYNDIDLCPLEHVLDIFDGKLLIKRYDAACAVCRCQICYIPFVSCLRENGYPGTLLDGVKEIRTERIDIVVILLCRDGDIFSALLLFYEEYGVAGELFDTLLDNVS